MINQRPDSDDQTTLSEAGPLVDHFFRHQYASLVATLTRRFGVQHWERVEDMVQSAMQRALATWSRRGIPANPAGWLYRVSANMTIDSLRRDRRWDDLSLGDQGIEPCDLATDPTDLHDDLLKMIFVCCDPMVPPESQIALALKTLCGFGNREIARALLTTEVSVAKRITRAKEKLRCSGVEPADIDSQMMRDRFPHAASVIYLLFNEGYSSTIAEKLIREELCEEAVRLALLLAEHQQTKSGPSAALLALLLFHASRLDARIDQHGAMLLLKEQDRTRWDRRLQGEAFRWLQIASLDGVTTRYHAEALIAAEHCRATSIDDTNWEHIVAAYDRLCQLAPSPVHDLNRAIAIGHHLGAKAGMEAYVAIDSAALENDYYLWHATGADLAQQMNDFSAAREAFKKAWQLAPTNAEKELICRKLDALPSWACKLLQR